MSHPANLSLTRYGWFVVLWVLVLSFQASLFSCPSLAQFHFLPPVRLPHFRAESTPGSPHLPALRP